MGLKDSRLQFKPFEYDWCYETWEKHEFSHWVHHDVLMQNDIKNWKQMKHQQLTEAEVAVLNHVFVNSMESKKL